MLLCSQCHKQARTGGFCTACGGALLEVADPPGAAAALEELEEDEEFEDDEELEEDEEFEEDEELEDDEERSSLPEIVEAITDRPPIVVPSSTLRRVGWFLLVNLAIIASLTLVSAGTLLVLAPFALGIGLLLPLIYLLLSKWMAIRSHEVQLIDPEEPADEAEADLYALVAALSQQAGLEKVPAVGWYESDDMNAFATGATRNNSLVAFSSALIEQMDAPGLAAIAAHEVAHIANGDMVTLALVESAVNAIVTVITLPFWLLKLFAFLSDRVSWAEYRAISGLKWLVSTILVFLGSLVVKGFSRRREFAADRLAATLVDRDSMIYALEVLATDEESPPAEQAALAAFKIKSHPAWWDLLSTHPSIERRIAALAALPDDA